MNETVPDEGSGGRRASPGQRHPDVTPCVWGSDRQSEISGMWRTSIEVVITGDAPESAAPIPRLISFSAPCTIIFIYIVA